MDEEGFSGLQIGTGMSPFLKTPLEIRNQIYGYLLLTKHTMVDFVDEQPRFLPSPEHRAHSLYHFHPAILAVNRILSESLFVKLTTNAPNHGLKLKDYGLRCVAESDNASGVTYPAIALTWMLDTRMVNEPLSTFIFPVDEMATFCSVSMHRTKYSSLSIAIRGVAPTTTRILKLLEPINRLHSLETFEITGQISDNYKSLLTRKIMKQPPEFETAVEEVQDTIEQGDQAAEKKNYSLAIAKYKSTVLDNDYNSFRPSVASLPILTRGKFTGHSVTSACIQIHFALSTKLAVTYLKTEKHSQAHQWSSIAIRLIHPYGKLSGACLGSAACAAIYSVAAQASEGLGLMGRAVEEMAEAVRHDPGDSNLVTELVRLKEKIGGDGDLQAPPGGLDVGCTGEASCDGADSCS